MSTIDVIPSSDTKFDPMQEILVTAVKNNAQWKIPNDAITTLTDKQTLWDNTWAVAKDKQNCTTAQRKAKDAARKAYVAVLRPFIKKWIYLNENMSDADIELCGLKPHDSKRSQTPVPDSLPLIDIVTGKGNTLSIIFRQQLNEPGSSRRGKPAGVAYCEIYYTFNGPPKSPDECTKSDRSSRSPIKVQLPTGMGGQTVWFYARWLNRKNEGGPFTTLHSFVIPF